MERIEDRSKALSYIGIEIADALKLIPTPVEEVKETVEEVVEQENYIQETTFEVKPSLWQRIKESKIGKLFKYAFRIRIVLDVPTLPEGKEQ